MGIYSGGALAIDVKPVAFTLDKARRATEGFKMNDKLIDSVFQKDFSLFQRVNRLIFDTRACEVSYADGVVSVRRI